MNYLLPTENKRTNSDLVCIPDDQDLRPEVPLADWTGVLFSHFDPVCLGTYPLLLDLQVFQVKEAAVKLQILRVRYAQYHTQTDTRLQAEEFTWAWCLEACLPSSDASKYAESFPKGTLGGVHSMTVMTSTLWLYKISRAKSTSGTTGPIPR